MLTAQRLIASGALGSIVRFESRLDRWRPSPASEAWRERGAPPPAAPRDAIAVLDIIEAAQRSAAQAQVVSFPQGC